MRAEEGSVKNSIGRAAFGFLAVLSQVIWILVLVLRLNRYSTVISLITTVVTLIVVLWMYNTKMPMGFKLPWIMLILAFPVLGLALYVLLGRSDITRGMRLRIEKIDKKLECWLKQDESILDYLRTKDRSAANQMNYISKYAKYPVYANTDVKFYKDASDGFEEQLLELEKAERFIFIEYHAIEDAISFGRMKRILAEKVKQGVDVRVLYDDVGSIGFIDSVFVKRMESLGIKCRVFNPLVPVLNMIMNNRDHRKITVIDGKVGFTGGYNLAD